MTLYLVRYPNEAEAQTEAEARARCKVRLHKPQPPVMTTPSLSVFPLLPFDQISGLTPSPFRAILLFWHSVHVRQAPNNASQTRGSVSWFGAPACASSARMRVSLSSSVHPVENPPTASRTVVPSSARVVGSLPAAISSSTACASLWYTAGR
ncbi:uncharacterized protein SCHCODRAFT_02630370 [Schizophyllum commune H4-8]|uniref:uncharacterized protein n=1 Tax=Schizophyllum commune (strain H4-8 / FGSC 9210) TaxID=578458 RepID=UPI00215F9A98|nr:uncharacterized protein SCHCODRAFT_02630370 [Schizophyllum commune H4-8]KAI5889904.1 hypothetical protein SCHCODRAFT_02630370 [Schizophyllum commune H4-8]